MHITQSISWLVHHFVSSRFWRCDNSYILIVYIYYVHSYNDIFIALFVLFAGCLCSSSLSSSVAFQIRCAIRLIISSILTLWLVYLAMRCGWIESTMQVHTKTKRCECPFTNGQKSRVECIFWTRNTEKSDNQRRQQHEKERAREWMRYFTKANDRNSISIFENIFSAVIYLIFFFIYFFIAC